MVSCCLHHAYSYLPSRSASVLLLSKTAFWLPAHLPFSEGCSCRSTASVCCITPRIKKSCSTTRRRLSEDWTGNLVEVNAIVAFYADFITPDCIRASVLPPTPVTEFPKALWEYAGAVLPARAAATAEGAVAHQAGRAPHGPHCQHGGYRGGQPRGASAFQWLACAHGHQHRCASCCMSSAAWPVRLAAFCMVLTTNITSLHGMTH